MQKVFIFGDFNIPHYNSIPNDPETCSMMSLQQYNGIQDTIKAIFLMWKTLLKQNSTIWNFVNNKKRRKRI